VSEGMTPAMSPELADLGSVTAGGGPAPFDALLDVSMPVVIEIGRTSMTVNEVLQLGAGAVVQLDRMVGEPVDVYVGDRRLAQGEVVVVGEHFGVRISNVIAGARSEAS
jgi:flagellar motor switch protein FliN